MALAFDNNKIFFHIVKTGGGYVRHCLKSLENIKRLNLETKEIGHVHKKLPQELLGNKKKTDIWICCIREPLDWYKSLFRYEVHSRHIGKKEKHHSGFEKFIYYKTQNFSHALLTKVYTEVVPYCDVVIDTANLTQVFKFYLNQWGLEWLPRFNNKKNVTPENIKTKMSDKIKIDLLKLEQTAVDLYKVHKLKNEKLLKCSKSKS